MAQLHPKYKVITVKQTNGESFQTRSTLGSEMITLEIDRYTHPAWKKDKSNFINRSATNVAKFHEAFGVDFTAIAGKK